MFRRLCEGQSVRVIKERVYRSINRRKAFKIFEKVLRVRNRE